MKNKKGIAPLFAIGIVVLALIGIYIFLLVPIPAFKSIRTQINYFLILIFWIAFQIGLVFGYYQIGKYAHKGFNIIKYKIVNWSLVIRKYILTHS